MRGIDRRTAIRSTALIALSIPASGLFMQGAAGATAQHSDQVVRVGVIRAIREQVITIDTGDYAHSTDGELLDVRPAAGARMYSGFVGVVPLASDFVTGDRVVVEGVLDGGTLSASSVGSLLEPLSAVMISLSADHRTAQTSVGVIDLDSGCNIGPGCAR